MDGLQELGNCRGRPRLHSGLPRCSHLRFRCLGRRTRRPTEDEKRRVDFVAIRQRAEGDRSGRNAEIRLRPLSAHHPSTKHRWEHHNDYEQAVVERCYTKLFPKWRTRLAGADAYLKDNCWAMLESLAVQFPETKAAGRDAKDEAIRKDLKALTGTWGTLTF